MLGICIDYAWNMHRLCWNIEAWNMAGICSKWTWNMHSICMEYARNTHGTCMGYAWNVNVGYARKWVWDVRGMHVECAWNMPRLYVQYHRPWIENAQNIPKVCDCGCTAVEVLQTSPIMNTIVLKTTLNMGPYSEPRFYMNFIGLAALPATRNFKFCIKSKPNEPP